MVQKDKEMAEKMKEKDGELMGDCIKIQERGVVWLLQHNSPQCVAYLCLYFALSLKHRIEEMKLELDKKTNSFWRRRKSSRKL